MSRLTRDGTAEPGSRDQIFRHARGQGNIHFPCSADHEQDQQPYPVDPYSAICDDHTYIHTYILVGHSQYSTVYSTVYTPKKVLGPSTLDMVQYMCDSVLILHLVERYGLPWGLLNSASPIVVHQRSGSKCTSIVYNTGTLIPDSA